MATVVPAPVPPSNENNFETIQKILYSPETTFNPGEIVESRNINNDKPIKVTQEKLSPSAIRYIVKKKSISERK